MAKFCTNCGKPLTEGARFCTGCGAQVLIDEGSRSGNIPHPSAKADTFPQRGKAIKKSTSPIFIIIPIIIVVVIVMVIVLTTIVGALFSGAGITTGAAGGEYNPTGKGEPQWVQCTGSPEKYPGKIYDYLPDEEKLIYDAIDECLTGESGEATARIPYELSEEALLRASGVYALDNPYIGNPGFYIEALEGTLYENGYMDYPYRRIRDYNSDMREIKKVVDEVVSSLSGTDSEKVKQINDYIASNTEYAEGTMGYTAYGALVEGKATCQGYSCAFKLICDEAGIPCYLLDGDAGGPHTWVIVQLEDGNWYETDLLWNDYYNNYNYFCIPTSRMNKDHNRELEETSNLYDLAYLIPETKED